MLWNHTFCGLSLFFQEISGTLSSLGHDNFLAVLFQLIIHQFSCSRVSIISIMIRLCVWRFTVRFPAEAINISAFQNIQTGSEAHTASYLARTVGSFPGVKWPIREPDHSPPATAFSFSVQAAMFTFTFCSYPIICHYTIRQA